MLSGLLGVIEARFELRYELVPGVQRVFCDWDPFHPAICLSVGPIPELGGLG